jgi:isopentenyl-diphosphate Delta-isomerase
MQDTIYYVDENDTPTGETASKLDAHTGDTRLHAAFSCYIFNEKGELLVTQRAIAKKVWPGVWTNSVCGHPAPGELRESAIVRRADFELGMKIENIQLIVPDYIYKTPPFKGIIEYEYCPVYVAHAASEVHRNPQEVEDYYWLPWDKYVQTITADVSDVWSWWCKDQLKHLQKSSDFNKLLQYLS